MMKTKRISARNTPASLRIINKLTVLFLLDYYNAPEWAWTLAILWIAFTAFAYFYVMATSKYVDIFSENYQINQKQ